MVSIVNGAYINLKAGYGGYPFYLPDTGVGPSLYVVNVQKGNDSLITGANYLGATRDDSNFYAGYSFPQTYTQIQKFNWYHIRSSGGCKYYKIQMRNNATGAYEKIPITSWGNRTITYNTDEAQGDCLADGWYNVSFASVTTNLIYINCTGQCAGGDYAELIMELDVFRDDTPPPLPPPDKINLINPLNNSLAVNKYATFAYNFTSYNLTASSSLFLNGVWNDTTASATINATNYFYKKFNNEGYYNWTINVTDGNGNGQSTYGYFTVDENPYEVNGTLILSKGTLIVRQCRAY